MDLADLWRRRRWVHLLGLIDQLPSTSRTRAAMMNDPELAEQYASLEGGDEPWAPPVAEWDTHAEILATATDRLAEVIQAIASTAGAKPKRPKPYPRPVTEIDRARRRNEHRAYLDGLAVFSPHALDNHN